MAFIDLYTEEVGFTAINDGISGMVGKLIAPPGLKQ